MSGASKKREREGISPKIKFTISANAGDSDFHRNGIGEYANGGEESDCRLNHGGDSDFHRNGIGGRKCQGRVKNANAEEFRENKIFHFRERRNLRFSSEWKRKNW